MVVRIRRGTLNSVFDYVINFILVFGVVFPLPIRGSLNTRVAFIAILLLYLVLHRKATLKVLHNSFSSTVYLSVGIAILLFILCVINEIRFPRTSGYGYYKPWYLIYLFLYIPVFATYCVVKFKSARRFARTYVPIIVLQSFVIFTAAINKTFRLFVYEHFYFGDDRFEKTITFGTRIMGINLHSASGSLILAGACILLTYLALKREINLLLHMITYAIIVGATIFVGRTGLYIEIFVFVFYMFLSAKSVKKTMLSFGAVALCVVVLSLVLGRIDPLIADTIKNWAGNAKNIGILFSNLSKQSFPNFTPLMIFGTNVMQGVLPDGQIMFSDSGYLMIITALGIIGAVGYYSCVLNIFSSSLKLLPKSQIKLFLIVILCIVFAVETKEPFINKYIFPWMLTLLLMFSTNETEEKEKE